MRHSILLNMAILAIVGICGFSAAAQAGVTTFDDLSLAADSNWHGPDTTGTYSFNDYSVTFGYTVETWSGGFSSGDSYFNNNYSIYDDGDETHTWDGWAYSNMTDTTTPGYTNDCSAITGQGFGGSANYGVGYYSAFAASPISVSFDSPAQVRGMYVTNTTYAYLSMLDGDSQAKQFGGASGTDADWFKLTIIGYDAGGAETGSLDFYLADYRFADSGDDYIIGDWTWVDLTSLGDNVSSLGFSMDSSDHYIDGENDYGMNTPSYFAVDNLTVVPEPSTFALLIAGILAALALRRRK